MTSFDFDTMDEMAADGLTDFQRGKIHLDAEPYDYGRLVYRDDATQSQWLVSTDEIELLGCMLREGRLDAYSHWCAETSAEELEAEE